MEAVDSYIPEPIRDTEKPFLMPVEGRILDHRPWYRSDRPSRGVLKVSNEVRNRRYRRRNPQGSRNRRRDVQKASGSGADGEITSSAVKEAYREQTSKEVRYWQHRALYIRIRSSREKYTYWKKEGGGRHTPFFNGYGPQFYFRTTDITGTLQLPAGTEMCMPGDNAT